MAGELEIPRVERPTREQFQEEFFKPQKPVIITGAIDDWPAMKKWSPEYFVANAAKKDRKKDARAEVVAAPPGGGEARFPYWENLGARFKHAPLDVMIKYIVEQSKKPGGEAMYLQGMSLKEELPALYEDIIPPQYIAPKLPYMTNLWFGTGGIVPLHFDPQQNLLIQIAGTKDVTLCPPIDLECFYPYKMYIDGHQTSRVNDIHAPDLARFPRFGEVPQYRSKLERGEMLFIPCYWWHQVHTEALAISLNLWYAPGTRYLMGHRYGPRFVVGSIMNLAYNAVAYAVNGGFKRDEKLVVP